VQQQQEIVWRVLHHKRRRAAPLRSLNVAGAEPQKV